MRLPNVVALEGEDPNYIDRIGHRLEGWINYAARKGTLGDSLPDCVRIHAPGANTYAWREMLAHNLPVGAPIKRCIEAAHLREIGTWISQALLEGRVVIVQLYMTWMTRNILQCGSPRSWIEMLLGGLPPAHHVLVRRGAGGEWTYEKEFEARGATYWNAESPARITASPWYVIESNENDEVVVDTVRRALLLGHEPK